MLNFFCKDDLLIPDNKEQLIDETKNNYYEGQYSEGLIIRGKNIIKLLTHGQNVLIELTRNDEKDFCNWVTDEGLKINPAFMMADSGVRFCSSNETISW